MRVYSPHNVYVDHDLVSHVLCVCVLCRELQQTLQSVETIQEEKNSLSKTTEELQTILLVRFHALLYKCTVCSIGVLLYDCMGCVLI